MIICEILGVLEGYPLQKWGFRSAQAVHYQIEAMRHAYVDRNGYLGDPDFVRNPIDRLLDKRYAEQIRAAIDPGKAGVSRDMRAGVPPHEGTNTTHYSIVDKDGNAVAVTYTLNEWFGAKVMPATTGIVMNNEMDDFTAKAGASNLYGLVQGEVNAIAPGKRPLSSMSPTIVSRDGKPVLVIGAPGRQPHHHRDRAIDPQHGRLWNESPGSHRRAADPPAMAAGDHVRRAFRVEPRHAPDADRHGPHVRRELGMEPRDGDHRGRAVVGRRVARRQPSSSARPAAAALSPSSYK